ncbi:tetratricopeptide repeat protein [Lentzea sp. NEAU-D13]|uniref:Tetratricopeptide repeat protein n=1 Tax=Lentzea alba TaxID=2714351 RepID=A0A7C9W0Q1_9PSEU|nr:tetratricopeptide repeat protein [Lentzea alba]NGY63401.1 tetratricopeptide repeat protein [Lentzea alba]
MDGEATNQLHGTASNVVQVRDVHGDLHLNQPRPTIRPVVPHQLPADVRQFSGRDDELRQLDALLAEKPSAVVICAIAGTAGVGKTALAVRWAHRARDRFPDGQLYVDLLGYSPDAPVQPAQALEGFLHALGVSGDAVPPRLDDQAALYRSLLDGRRMLVVLDNASSPDQVRPLLPGSASCFALVTSRSGLAGLVARNGAQRLTLDLLSHNESLRLLRDLVGVGRVDAEPESSATLVDQCGRLPLALRVAGERAAAEPDLTLSELVAELADERGRLDLLGSDDEDASTAVRAVFSWSYRSLSPPAARLFRLLGLHPGPDFSAPVAAELADVPLPQAKRLLLTLAGAHLVQANGPGRYRFHDVLRLYAAELAESDERRLEAARRMLCWYLHCATIADSLLLPLVTTPRVRLPDPPATPPPFTTRSEALAWCESEAANLAAAARHAHQLGEHSLAAQFPRALWGYYDLRKPWSDWITTYEIGLSSARLLKDDSTCAGIIRALGVAYYDLQRFDEAAALFEESLVIRRAIGDFASTPGNLDMLGSTYRKQGDFAAALDCHRQALAIRLESDHKRGIAVTLNRLGSTYRDLERFDESLDHLNRSLALRREIGDLHGQGFALHSIAATYEQLGRLDEAMEAYRESLVVRREIGDRRGEAEILLCLGKILARRDRPDEARDVWTEALATFSDLGAPQASDVVRMLEGLGHGEETWRGEPPA